MRITVEIRRLWRTVKTKYDKWLIFGFPYLALLVIAMFRLHHGLRSVFYSLYIPAYIGYSIGYIAVWYSRRHQQDAYVHSAALFCAFNLTLFYFTPGGIFRTQIVTVALAFFFTIGSGILLALIRKRKP